MPRIVPANPTSTREAAERLRAGGVIAFPTETVYGLGACTLNERAIDRIYQLKGRPADNPLIAHVTDAAQAREIIAKGAWTSRCETLTQRFWPGPLTLVLARAERVPAQATAGLATIAVRSPAHTIARGLLEAIGQPVSAPSANRSGRVSPTSAQHVFEEFKDVADARDLMILDGGACEIGIESTVLDVSTATPRILRHGSVTLEQLRDVIGEIDAPELHSQHASPGTAESHYAPRTPVELVDGGRLRETLEHRANGGVRCVTMLLGAHQVRPPHAMVRMPPDALAYAQEMYRALREADAMGLDRIVIESPPSNDWLWRAIVDRLRRAASR